jgi:DHA2 family multidrug resistance protein
MDTHLIIVSGFLSGVGTGLIFVPLSTIAFATVRCRSTGPRARACSP